MLDAGYRMLDFSIACLPVTFSIQYQVSSIKYPVSSFQHQHPVKRFAIADNILNLCVLNYSYEEIINVGFSHFNNGCLQVP